MKELVSKDFMVQLGAAALIVYGFLRREITAFFNNKKKHEEAQDKRISKLEKQVEVLERDKVPWKEFTKISTTLAKIEGILEGRKDGEHENTK